MKKNTLYFKPFFCLFLILINVLLLIFFNASCSCKYTPNIKPTSIEITSPLQEERVSYVNEDGFFSDYYLSCSVEPKNADKQVNWSIEDFDSHDDSTIDIFDNKIHFKGFRKKTEVIFLLKCASASAPDVIATKELKLTVKDLPQSISLLYVDNSTEKPVSTDLQAFFNEPNYFTTAHLQPIFTPTDAYDKIDFRIDQDDFPSKVHVDDNASIYIESLSDTSKTDKYNFTISCFSSVKSSIASLPLSFSCSFISRPESVAIDYNSGTTNMKGFCGESVDFPGTITTKIMPNTAPQDVLLSVIRNDKFEGTIKIGDDNKIHCEDFNNPTGEISFKIMAKSAIDSSVSSVYPTDFKVTFIRKPTNIELNYTGDNSATTFESLSGSFNGTLSTKVYPEDADQTVIYSIVDKNQDFSDADGTIEITDGKINFKNFKKAGQYKFKIQAKSFVLDTIIAKTDTEFILNVQESPKTINIKFLDEFDHELEFTQNIYATPERAHIFGSLSATILPTTAPQDVEWSIEGFEFDGEQKIELVKSKDEQTKKTKVEIYYSGFSYNLDHPEKNTFNLKIRATSIAVPSIYSVQTFKINIIPTPSGDLPENVYIVDKNELTGLRVLFSDKGTKEIYKNCTRIVLPEQIKDIKYDFSSNVLDSIKDIDMSKCLQLTFSDDTNQNMFSGWESITTVEFSDSTKIIPKGMFSNCTNLQKITFPHNSEASYTISENAFSNDKNIEEIMLHNVSTIAKNAFLSCSGIYKTIFGCSEIAISSLSIGEKAFEGCSNMSTLIFYFNSNVFGVVSSDAFDNIPSAGNIKNVLSSSSGYTSSKLLEDLKKITTSEDHDSPFSSWTAN